MNENSNILIYDVKEQTFQILESNENIQEEKTGNLLLQESLELKKIFSSMVGKSS